MTGKHLRKIIRQSIALNILYIREKNIYPAYMSKFNLTREKKHFLMILNEEKEVQLILIFRLIHLF